MGALTFNFLNILALIFIIIASTSTNLIVNFIPSQYTLINFLPFSLSVKSAGFIITVIGFVVGIFWLTFLSQVGALSFIDTFGAFFGPLFGVMISDFYYIQKGKLNNKDIIIDVFESDHSVKTLTYGFSERKKKLKKEYIGLTSEEIVNLKRAKVEIVDIILEKTFRCFYLLGVNVNKLVISAPNGANFDDFMKRN